VVIEWAYTLEDQVDPNVLTLRTRNGSYRIERTAEWACQYIYANQNVQLQTEGEAAWLRPASEDWSAWCQITILDQVDPWTCWTNKDGDCDVRVENEGGTE